MNGFSSRISKTRRRAVIAGGTALVLAGLAAHAAGAEDQTEDVVATTATAIGPMEGAVEGSGSGQIVYWSAGSPQDADKHRQDWINALAGKLGVTPQRLQQAIDETSQALGFPPPLIGSPRSVGVPAGNAFKIELSPDQAAVAKALGISEDQLRKEWPVSDGRSLTDVARAHNVDPKIVADALKAKRRADLDAAVAQGGLPADVANRLKANLDREIDGLMQISGAPGGGQVMIRVEKSP
jgi:hypothetical protein